MDPMQYPSGINYFTCTIGQAAHLMAQRSRDFDTVNAFLDARCKDSPDDYAVGFPLPPKIPSEMGIIWPYWLLSEGDLIPSSNSIAEEHLAFYNLRNASILAAKDLRQACRLEPLSRTRSTSKTMALLCPSSPEFLFAWLGLMRLGYSVLLIAPQCQAPAIAHLCKTCDVTILIYDPIYSALAEASHSASDSGCKLDIVRIPNFTSPTLPAAHDLNEGLNHDYKSTDQNEHDTAFLFHTSGTSTGLPKPIAQSHKAAVGVLPCLDTGRYNATFTTTPLYHGGIADCFRAWTSGALIWLFPGKDVPVTATNVLKSLECADQAHHECQTPAVRYFSSVPYVLQMVAAELRGLEMLKSMDIVGVGGAALPQAAGDDLVRQGVNLVSRFGSAECGFLMSSHRNYGHDKEWQYLRSDSGSEALSFEPAHDGLAELVVLPQWPHIAKRNRENGSFATADIFSAHPTIPNAWKYHSRADSQLTLITGKKFDPAPLETSIATSPLLSDVFVFGDSQHYPGALLFRSEISKFMDDVNLLNQIWPNIEAINAEGQVHTRLSRSMLIALPVDAPRLEKSSKGTILRSQAEKQYQSVITQAYEDIKSGINSIENTKPNSALPDDEMASFVLETIKSVTGITDSIPEDADLFSIGVDSVACMQIRIKLQQRIITPGASNLPLNVVYDSGSIRRLSMYLVKYQKGQATGVEDEIKTMLELVEEYSTFSDESLPVTTESAYSSNGNIPPNGEIVLLTGATGALGAHIFSQLRSNTNVSRIYCLVRASSAHAAHERISKSLVARGKPGLDAPSLPPNAQSIHPIICTIGAPLLGLSQETYTQFSKSVNVIIHAAWAVNFSVPLRSFVKDHIRGLHNLLNFCIASPTRPRFVFCSSTASVISSSSNPVSEVISFNPNNASTLGYSRSKWVAEAICNNAALHAGMGDRVAVVRVGQLCGDTKNGIWNTSEAWPLMLSTAKSLGCLPNLDERLGWLPVDIAAAAVLEIAFAGEQMLEQTELEKKKEAGQKSCPVYHVVNPNDSTTWDNLLFYIQTLTPTIKTVPVKDWLTKLENEDEAEAGHPARKLLGLWKGAYANNAGKRHEQVEEDVGGKIEQGNDRSDVTWDMTATRAIAPVMGVVQAVSEEQIGKMWRWVEREMM